jgi:di/tricarboxylate transporter
MLLPVLRDVSNRTGISASRLFMPLSFAAILGGVCTLIGTSTNLVTQGLLVQSREAIEPLGGRPMSMWTLSVVGVPIAVAGVAYMLLLGRRLLPDRRPNGAAEGARRYMTAMQVGPGAPIAGKTIEAAGLRHLPGLFLSRIDRGPESVIAVAPDEVVRPGDVLVFVGVVESVVDLQKIKGLAPVADGSHPVGYRPKLKLVEAVVSSASPLIGRSIRDAEFRTNFGGVVIAVHRYGEHVPGRIGDIVLRPGDTLLLESDAGFAGRYRNSVHFHLVSEVAGAAAPRHERAVLAFGILAAMVTVMTFEWLDHMVAAFVAAVLMVLTRCCSAGQARAGMDWPVLVVIGASMGVGRAMEKTGLAGGIAEAGAAWAGAAGPWGLLAAVYVLTLAFTTVVNNNAAVALMFPIVVSIARGADMNLMPLVVAMTIAASCEFTTPLGYQTNLIVMGPGGYRWSDYFRFGGPLTLLCAAVAIGLIPLAFGPLSLR